MELYVREHGPAAAETIIFLHGGGVGSWMWHPVIELLPGFHCLAPDLPEHGRSMAVKPFSILGAADMIADLIAARAHGGRAHLVGLSLGAQVGVALLARAPERVDHAILSSPLVQPLPGAGLGLYHPFLMALSYWTFIAPFKRLDAWIRLNMRYAVGIPEQFFGQFRQDFQTQTASSFTHVMSQNMYFRRPAGLERVVNPVLLLAGEQEYAVMRRSVQALAQVLPNSQAYQLRLPDGTERSAQHNWALVSPHLFATTVRSWTGGQPLPPELQPL